MSSGRSSSTPRAATSTWTSSGWSPRRIAEAGVDDFAATDGFWDRVAAYVGAVEADDGLTQLIRGTLRQRIVRLLRNRLSLTELLKRHPEIESIPIEKPFIVVGMPRSGTTHLVNLLAADPRRRALPYWESQEPLPIPGQGPDVYGVDPRYTRAKNEHDAMMVSAPATAAMHDRFPEAIEEEVEILDLDFAGYVLEWHARVPGWRDFYLGLDQTPALRVHEEGPAGVDVPARSPHVGAEVAAALRAARPADGDVPRRHRRLHPPRSRRGDPVDDHDDGLLRPAAPPQHRTALAARLLGRPRRSGC